ncbi:MAG TPA: peptide MFS transporter [Planctomycetota bacterium]|nr:peptide MFS transporter [Planctomycetota bacterium]
MVKDPTSQLGTPEGHKAALTPPRSGGEPRGFFGHPRGLQTLFFTEMWERFSYYGMRAILILFMTAAVANGGLGFDANKAGAIYGVYTSLVYIVALPGGWLADRFLGQQRSVLYGGIVIMLGHISLAVHGMTTFYLGLVLIVIGTGLLKPNISVMVGQLYGESDRRRDSGFSIFYMGINMGAFLAPLVCSWLAQNDDFRAILAGWEIDPNRAWHWGFAAAAVGMFLGLVQYLVGLKHLSPASRKPVPPADAAEAARSKKILVAGLGIAAVLAIASFLLVSSGTVTITEENVGTGFGFVLFGSVIAFFGWLFFGGKWTVSERRRLIVIAVLFVAAAIFWSAFEQAGSTLNLFARDFTHTEVFGWDFESGYYQSLNPLFIILLAPVFAWLWIKLGRRDPSSAAKFSIGLLLVGLGFVVLIGGAQAAQRGIMVSPWWLFFAYLLHTLGELCLSPVGLSAMTKLAPARVASLMMGVWFLAASVGNYMGGTVARFYEDFSLTGIFGIVGAFCVGAAVIMVLLVKPIRRMMERPS